MKTKHLKKTGYLLKIVFSIFTTLTFINAQSQVSDRPPSAVVNIYNTNPDWKVSDNFSSIDFNKWVYRKDQGNGIGEGTQYVYIVNNSYVSFKGDKATKKGGGLSSLNTSHFGFYLFKWRVLGISKGVRTAWHPSVWTNHANHGATWKVLNPRPNETVELDLLEYWNVPVWNSHAIPKVNGLAKNPKPAMVRSNPDINNKWRTFGIEYTPNYLQLWEKINGNWRKIGTRVTISNAANSATNLNKKHAQPFYNILSNKYHTPEGKDDNSWFHIDYFYVFPYKGGSGNGGSGGNGNPIVTLRKGNSQGFAIDGGNGGRNGQNVKLWAYNQNNVNQQWEEINRGNGFYSYKKQNTNFCIDAGNGGSNGQSVKLWSCGAGNQNQHFKKVSVGNNRFRLEKRNASGFSIDGNNGGGNNQNVHIWSSNNNNGNQQWIITAIGTASKNTQGFKSKNLDTSELIAVPNPASNVLNLKGLGVGTHLVRVVNSLGALVLSKELKSVEGKASINVSNLNVGIYVLITGDKAIRFVKN